MENQSFLIYNASAGSGKTYTLVRSYLEILFQSPTDDAYKKILAMTFTNKAVNEMKTRIVNSLHAFSLDETPLKHRDLLLDIAQRVKKSPEEIKQKAKRITRSIIHNYAAFTITTIDKFTLQIIRSFALDLNLPATFEVTFDTDDIINRAVDRVIAKAGIEDQYTKFLIHFAIQKLDDDKSWDLSYDLIKTGKMLISEKDAAEIENFHSLDIEYFSRAGKAARIKANYFQNRAIEIANQILDIIEENDLWDCFSRKTYSNSILRVIDKDNWKEFDKIFKSEVNENFITINKPKQEKAAPFLDNLQDLTKEIELCIGKYGMYHTFVNNVTSMSVMHSIFEEMQNIQEEENKLIINKFNKIIQKEISNQPAPFIYERIGERFRHFFIDEFQDTSELQWTNLIPLIENALAGQDNQGTSGSLMIVGDPKQSIYRWRGGKAEQFIQLFNEKQTFPTTLNFPITLGKNYRSYSQIIEFNNDFFKIIGENFTNPDYRHIYENESHQETNSKSGGYVNIRFLESGRKKAEQSEYFCTEVINIIRDVLEQGFSYKDIAILVRTNEDGSQLASTLTSASIPVISAESLLMEKSQDVQLLIHTLSYLKDNNREAQFYLLLYIGKNIGKEELLHDFIYEGLSHTNEIDFQNWLATHHFNLSFEKLRSYSLYEIVNQLIKIFLPEKSTNAYVQYFADVALEQMQTKQMEISDFLEYWQLTSHKLSIPTPEEGDAVQIMTIHKSKGLEFPVVIYPFANDDLSKSNNETIWLEVEDEFEEWNPYKFNTSSSKKVTLFGEKAKEVFENQSQERLLDTINVLYVALTRAEEQLYIVSEMNINKNGNLSKNLSLFFINYLIQKGMFTDTQFEYDFGNKRTQPKEVTQLSNTKTIEAIKETITSENIKIAQREALMWGTGKADAISFGNILHELMANIYSIDEIEIVLNQAKRKGILTETQKKRLESIIYKILTNKELEVFFEKDNKNYNEQIILLKNSPNLKPDRIAIKGKKAYILDYKTGSPQPKYHHQMESYAHILSQMGYDVEKKILVYLKEDSINIINL